MQSNLDGFISKLMSDDSALKKFLADPTNGGQEHGITKAERAVLRRVTAHLSNKSKNGLGIQRDLGSYRRSLRLLQNVLHKHGATHASILEASESTPYTFHVYFTGDPKHPGAPYENPSLAYTTYVTFTKSGTFTTIGEAMGFPKSPQGEKITVELGPVSGPHGDGNLVYTAQYLPVGGSPTHFDWYVISFTLSGFPPDTINGTYALPFPDSDGPVTGADRSPFWFFSLDGKAISPNSNQGYSRTKGVIDGDEGEGFADFPLKSSTYIVWQPIAPDMDYGFSPCFPTSYTPVVLGIPILEQDVVQKGEAFYTQAVNNVQIPEGATHAYLSKNPDGSGEIYTDDAVTIEFVGTKGQVYSYYHDYSNKCSGKITPTPPVDILHDLESEQLVGEIVSITIIYTDICGGKISSSGYFLVFE